MRELPLGATLLASRLRARTLSAVDVVDACLERIALKEPELQAWACIDADFARGQARSLDAAPIRGPLHGIPIGVKDILDTAELPTAYGSTIYRGHRPEADAACVAAARAAGAIVLGKTATAEFACMSPAATRNPRDPARTPGGSSSGTAAGVADGMMPLGFGTQTAGSIIRPASYCGIVGYKPTFGMIERAGLKLVAGSLDTIGVLARTVRDAALFAGAIVGRRDLIELPGFEGTMRIGVCTTHDWDAVTPDMAAALERAAQRLAKAGARVSRIPLPDKFAALGEAHAAIQGFEAARRFGFELREHRAALSPPLLAMLDEGGRVPTGRYQRSLEIAGDCRARLASVMGECDVLLAPSAAGEAPAGLESTGSPIMNRVWTLLHAPCVNVPAGSGAHGLPLGVQVIGRCGDDARALAAAEWIHNQRLSIE